MTKYSLFDLLSEYPDASLLISTSSDGDDLVLKAWKGETILTAKVPIDRIKHMKDSNIDVMATEILLKELEARESGKLQGTYRDTDMAQANRKAAQILFEKKAGNANSNKHNE